MTWRNGALQWVAAFAISIAFNLPRQLNRHHHVSHRLSVQVLAAISLTVLFAVVIRLVFFLVSRFTERTDGNGGGPGEAGPAGTAGSQT